MPKKYFCMEELIDEKYYDLSNKAKVEVLENALGLMESSNSQSYNDVIIKSMGFVISDKLIQDCTVYEKEPE